MKNKVKRRDYEDLELADTLTAISVIAKRLANKLRESSEQKDEKEGGDDDE